MRPVRAALAVAREIGADLASRRIGWVALALAALVVFGFLWILHNDLVDGAAAAVRKLGMPGRGAVDDETAARFISRWASSAAFWALLAGSVLLSSSFAPPLLDPRRTILVLAQPISRADLATGIWLAVTAVALAAHLFLVTLLFAGVRVLGLAASPRLLLVPLTSTLAFSALYLGVLVSAYLLRNALLGAAVGLASLLLCVATGFDSGADSGWRAAANAVLPKIAGLSRQSMRIGGGESVSLAPFVLTAAFVVAMLLIVRTFVQRMER